MTSEQSTASAVSVSNIGGIEEKTVEFTPGITILAGRNATNRTSLLTAITGALGSDNVALKSDAEEGHVKLTLGDEIATRRLVREGDTVAFSGDPYLDDAEIADLFAFLLEFNDARRAVVRNRNLRDLIMRPVDTDEIEVEIRDLAEEKRRVRRRIDELDALEDELLDRKRERATLLDEIETRERQLEKKRAAIEESDSDLERTHEEQNRLEEKFQELRDHRSELDAVESELRRKQESLDTLRERRVELEADREELPADPDGTIREIESQIDQLRGELDNVDATVNEIQTIIQFNEEKLYGSNNEISEALGTPAAGQESPTDRLVGEKQVVCWTCGSEVEESAVAEVIDQLREMKESKLARREQLNGDIDELTEEKITHQEQRRQREQVEDEYDSVLQRIEQREERVAELDERRSKLEADTTDLQEEIDGLEQDDSNAILELHKEANELELELGRMRQDRDRLRDEIEELEDQVTQREGLVEQRDELSERLEGLRTTIDRTEAEAVSEFNENMDAILGIMQFENIERIWIERVEREVRRGRGKVEETAFELHIVRATSQGATYQDSIDNLSQSERETTGLVFALAGYLAHEVYEEVPVMMLDSLEAIDSDRIASLVEYFGQYAEYLIVALLEEDAAAVDGKYSRIREF